MNSLLLLSLAFLALSLTCSGQTQQSRLARRSKNVIHSTSAQFHEVSEKTAKAQLKRMSPKQRALKEKLMDVHAKWSAIVDSSGNATFTDYYEYALLANISLGTPWQNFIVKYDFWSSDVEVIDVSAIECDPYYNTQEQSYSVECQAIDQVKDYYNASASSTFSNLTSEFDGDNTQQGYLAQDNANIDGVTVNSFQFGVLNIVDYWLDQLPLDGVMGLAPIASSNGINNVLSQLTPNLDSSVITFHIKRAFGKKTATGKDSSAQIALGSNQLSQCNASGWQTFTQLNKVDSDYTIAFPPPFQSSAMTVAPQWLTGDCMNGITAAHPVQIVDMFYPITTSFQGLQVFQKASGAVWNANAEYYTVSNVAAAGNVNLTLADGQALVITPKDYTLKIGKYTYMYVFGIWDENDPSQADQYVVLGQQFLNTRCISYDINANTLAITNALV